MNTPHRLQAVAASVALACCSLCTNVALAQSRTGVGSGNPVDQLPKLGPPPRPAVTIDLAPPAAATPLADRTVELKQVAVEGVVSVPFDEVQAVFAPFLGKHVKISELVEAAKQVTAIYQAAGFALAFCFIPEQELSAGHVRIVVVEGFVKDLRIEGEPGGSEDAIRSVAEAVTGERPLRTASFTRLVALLARIPGVAIEASVPSPTTTDGATTLILKVKHKLVTISTTLDTYRPGARVLATVTVNGLTPLGEQTTLTSLVSKDTSDERFIALGEAIPVGRDGMVLKLDAYHYGSDSMLALAPGINGTDRQSGDRVSISDSMPLVIALDHQLILNAGFDLAHSSDSYSGEAALYLHDLRDNLRIIHVGASAIATVAPNQLAASADVYRGLPVLGSSTSSSSVDPRFTRITLAMTDKLNYTEQLSSNFAMRGQYSRDRLASTEQIGFGGSQFGLGYPISDAVGDRGIGLSADLARSFFIGLPGLKKVEPYIALDTARVYSNLLPNLAGHLESAALGARFTDGSHYNVDFAIARPIGALPTDGSGRALRFDLNFAYRTD